MKQKTFMSLVLYVRNEQDSVNATLESLGQFLANSFELYEIIVIDDSSLDDTLQRARQVVAGGGYTMTVVELARRHGVEAAMQAGLERAVGDWVLELESSELDFELSLLEQLYECASQGFEIVTAAGDRGSRRSRLFYRLVNRYADLDEPLRTVRIRLTSRRSLTAMLSMKEKVRYRKALYAFVGARQHHVVYRPVKITPSRRAAHRLDRERTSLAFDVLLSFSGFGLRLAHRLSFGFGLLSLAAIAYALFVYLFIDNVVQGWTTMTALLAAGFAGVFLVLGVIGEYLARILIEVRARPLYSVRATDVVVPSVFGSNGEAAPFLSGQRLLTDHPHQAAR